MNRGPWAWHWWAVLLPQQDYRRRGKVKGWEAGAHAPNASPHDPQPGTPPATHPKGACSTGLANSGLGGAFAAHVLLGGAASNHLKEFVLAVSVDAAVGHCGAGGAAAIRLRRAGSRGGCLLSELQQVPGQAGLPLSGHAMRAHAPPSSSRLCTQCRWRRRWCRWRSWRWSMLRTEVRWILGAAGEDQ